ncbi:hypothetical protein [Pseudodonghicola sp.]|uniref:hypothetical protein n=1 Tax=Pseudodonghicola sp. TaxID=1969463 RepID=UPI003A984BED
MPRSHGLHDAGLFNAAMAKKQRRCQLWHAARLACPTYESFRQSCGVIERAIAEQLEREFSAP